MLYNFVRDSFAGRLIYHLSLRKLFKYKEEQADYVIPEKYLGKSELGIGWSEDTTEGTSLSSDLTGVVPGQIVVGWDGDDDPENPYNWPLKYKVFFILEMCLLTSFVYMASAIYTPGIEQLMEDFQVGRTLATLPLTMFVIGYGLGPMVFSPLSENARFGRTSIYIITLFVFFILQIPSALSKDIASLTVLRFLAGIFASPCLATGPASVGDVTAMPWIPVSIGTWSMAAVSAPSMGPLIGAVLTVKGGFHWAFWFVAITSGASLIVLTWLLPESYGKTILYRKAERLRAVTGNDNITSEGHIENSKLNPTELLIETLWRPLEIIVKEPVVLLIDIYLGLIYAILYLWFEAFPIVFLETYGYTLVELGVAYVVTIIGVVIGAIIYLPYIYKRFTKKLLNNEEVVPEVFLPISIFGSVLMPIGLFIFGWSTTASVHWILLLIGCAIFACGAFLVFQTLFNYMSMSFFHYMASVFAGNDLFRTTAGGLFPLFGHALFSNLKTKKFPIAWGSTILAFSTTLMILIPVFFYLNGPKLRARSKYAST